MAEEFGSMARDALGDVNGGESVAGGASSLTPEAEVAPEPIKPIQPTTASELSPDDGSGAITDGLKAPDANALNTAINAAKSEAMKRMLRGMAENNSDKIAPQPNASAVNRLASTVANNVQPAERQLQPQPVQPAQELPEVTMGRSIFGGNVPTHTRKDNVVVELGDVDMNDKAASAKAVSEANELIDMMHDLYGMEG